MYFSRDELGMIWDALVEFIHTSEENLYRYGDTMPGDGLGGRVYRGSQGVER
jgi:hypothetical protein